MKSAITTVILGTWLSVLSLNVSGQSLGEDIKISVIEPYKIAVSLGKTSNIIFPYAIISVDRGSSDVLVQKAKAVENILQIKAAQKGFANTNLSVITADGHFYSFLVQYAEQPSPLNMSFSKDYRQAQFDDIGINQMLMDSVARKLKNLPGFLNRGASEQMMEVKLSGVYLAENAMWLALSISNKSLIDFIPERTQFSIEDKKRSKRTAVQQKELTPLYNNSCKVIKGADSVRIVYGFVPFIFSRDKQLIIRVAEGSGGRSLELRVPARVVLKARLLSE